MLKIPALSIPLWAKMLLMAGLLAVGVGVGYHYGFQSSQVHAQKQTIEQLQKEQVANQQLQDKLDKLRADQQSTSAKLQDALSKLNNPQSPEVKYVYRTITKEIEKPVYQQCVVPASGMHAINANATELNKLRKPTSKN